MRIEKKLDERATVEKPMSNTNISFTNAMLCSLNMTYETKSPITENGGDQMEKYIWKTNESESQGQPGCKQILEGEMLPLKDNDNKSFGLYDVRGHKLPVLHIGNRKSFGVSDLGVGPKTDMDFALNANDFLLVYSVALVELKTGKSQNNLAQLLLQLVSFSKISNALQGVAVLGTDCADKWTLLYFSEYNKIVVQPYVYGKKCIADFKTLIVESTKRKQNHVATPQLDVARPQERLQLDSINEIDDTDLNLQEFGLVETPWDKAVARQNYLQRLACALGDLYGERVDVPFWVTASETCTSYDK